MNEPVAWMFQGAFDISTYVSFEKPNPDIYPNPIPLYTHPAKELLAKDILDVYQSREWYEDFNGELWFNWLKFADAILRKAQEK